jgi:glycosyltransferase involved in cell wall biosynthesis
MSSPVFPPSRDVFRPTGTKRSYGFLSTFSPTPCGIATFSAALGGALAAQSGASIGVVRVGANPGEPFAAPVVGDLVGGSSASVEAAVELLNQFDVAVVQHEYGIYGGADGDDVLAVLDGLRVPVIVVAHTVVDAPTEHQRFVLNAVAHAADVVVVMTEAARRRLCSRFDVDEAKVVTIPHRDHRARPTILTWGLLGPGKGVEGVIDSLVELRDLRPRPRYLVAGRTHPKVLAANGEAYREMLVRRASANGVAPMVEFDPSYRDLASLATLIRGADVVVLPYDSRDQATSGVLVDAGRPVIATAFPHAIELLSSGAGIVVPHHDPAAIAAALRRVLTEPGLAAAMSAEARRLSGALAWPAVAARYAVLADGALERVELAAS